MKTYTNKQRIIIYIAVTFALTYAYEILALPSLLSLPASTFFVTAAMLFPAIGSVITRLITREGFKDMYIKLNLKVKGNIKYYIMGAFLPAALIIVGTLLYALIFPNEMTFIGFSFTQLGYLIFSAVISPIVNLIPCFGEELGWRGYLVPKMNEYFGFTKNCIISGIIWGLWHAPLTVMGHNYGLNYMGYPFLGIAAMCLFCIVNGIIFSYVALKAKSCIPAALAHGSLNGMGSLGIMFLVMPSSYNPFIGPTITGIVGGIGLIAAAVFIAVRVKNRYL